MIRMKRTTRLAISFKQAEHHCVICDSIAPIHDESNTKCINATYKGILVLLFSRHSSFCAKSQNPHRNYDTYPVEHLHTAIDSATNAQNDRIVSTP